MLHRIRGNMRIEPNFEETRTAIPRTEKPHKMISVTKEGEKTKVSINSSSLDVIQTCMRKSKLQLLDGWLPIDDHPAKIFGSAWHKAMEVYYTGSIEERILPELAQMELMSYGHKIEKEEEDLCLRATRAFIERAQPLKALPETDKRSIQNGVWILHHYFKSFLADPYVAFVDKDGPFIERGFEFRLCESDDLVIYCFGTIDFVLRDVRDDSLVPGDHKTTSFLNFQGASYYDRAKPNHQYTLYNAAVEEVFGIKSQNFMINEIEVKAKPKTVRGQPPNFPRQITPRSNEDYAELAEVLIYYVHRYLEGIKTGIWPLGPVGSCTAYGSCTYRQVCSSPIGLRDNILNAKFLRNAQ